MSLEQHYPSIPTQFDEDVNHKGLLSTPKRAAKAMKYLCRGYQQNPGEIVSDTLFSPNNSGMVLVKDIELYSLCEHHLLPFIGKAHMAYVPNGRVLSLSKVARTVDTYARRPQIQENTSRRIAKTAQQVAGALGVMVVIQAQHICMMMRGTEKQNSFTAAPVTFDESRNNAATHNELLSLIR